MGSFMGGASSNDFMPGNPYVSQNTFPSLQEWASSPGSTLASVEGINNKFQQGPYQQGNIYTPEQFATMQQNAAQIYNEQQGLAQMLQAQARGQGPNPAQEQYKLNVQHNIANAQGLIASQRGTNPALATRMGANAASAQLGEAAGRSAVLQAQQQLGAESQLGGLYGQMQSGNLSQQSLYQQANTAAMQSNMQKSLANQQASIGAMSNMQQGIGSMLMALNKGGSVPHLAMGGSDEIKRSDSSEGYNFTANDPEQQDFNQGQKMAYADAAQPQGGAQSDVGKYLSNIQPMPLGSLGTLAGVEKASDQYAKGPMGGSKGGGGGGAGAAAAAMSKGGNVKDFRAGGHVPGKAKVAGDSLKNDTVPAMVSPGEIVIPRSVAQGPDAVNKSAQFVAAVLAKKQMGKKK